MERITNISAWSLIFSKLPGVAYNELMSCRGPWFVVRSGRTQLLKKNQKKSLKVKIKTYRRMAEGVSFSLLFWSEGERGRVRSLFQMKLEIRGEEGYRWILETFPPVDKLGSHLVD